MPPDLGVSVSPDRRGMNASKPPGNGGGAALVGAAVICLEDDSGAQLTDYKSRHSGNYVLVLTF